MLSTWQRKGNFFLKPRQTIGQDYFSDHAVCYKNPYSVKIKQIKIARYPDNTYEVTIISSPFKVAEVGSACLRHFEMGSEIEDPRSPCVITATESFIPKFKTLVAELCPNEFSTDFFIELERIICKNFLEHTHLISDEKIIIRSPYSNPLLNDSMAIDRLFSAPTDKYTHKKLEYLLSAGEDANKALAFIIMSEHPESLNLLKLLLFYSESLPNLFLRHDYIICFTSAMEMAYEFNHIDKLNLMSSAYNQPVKPPKNLLTVINTKFSMAEAQIKTEFLFSDKKKIISFLGKSPDFTLAHKKRGFHLMEKHLANIPLEDFMDEENLLEFICNEEKEIIGMNVFQLFYLDNIKNYRVLHCAFSFISPAYSGYGIISLLAFRLAFSFALLTDNYQDVIFFTAIHYNSYRLVDEISHYPKIQTPHLEKLREGIFKKIYGDEVKFHHDGLTCFTEESVKVVESKSSKTSTFNEMCFNQFFLTYNEEKPRPPRGAPIIFYVNESSAKTLSKRAEKLGINYAEHLRQFSFFIPSLLPNKECGVTHTLNSRL